MELHGSGFIGTGEHALELNAKLHDTTWPISIRMGDFAVHLTPDQARKLDRELSIAVGEMDHAEATAAREDLMTGPMDGVGVVSKYTLVLRTVASDMTSRDGFLWPVKGPVECSDWDPTPECRGGLHGLAWGMGDATVIPVEADRKWLVVRVLTSDLVEFEDKVKFPRGTVVHCGDQISATAYLVARAPAGTVCHYHHASAGYGGTASAGDYGTASAGYKGTASAGYRGTASAGDWGTASAGEWGELHIRWWDGTRYRTAVAYVGEDGIEPRVLYRLDAEHKFVRVEEQS